jgi:hypothetical protein
MMHRKFRTVAGLPLRADDVDMRMAEFFGELAEEEDFQRLRAALEAAVNDIKMYRFGAANVTYFLVGTAQDRRLAGVQKLWRPDRLLAEADQCNRPCSSPTPSAIMHAWAHHAITPCGPPPPKSIPCAGRCGNDWTNGFGSGIWDC